MRPQEPDRCPHCDGTWDLWSWDTEHLAGGVRKLVAALSAQMLENPGVPRELEKAWERLDAAAENFTNTLYRSEP